MVEEDTNLIDKANQAALRIELATEKLNEANKIKDELLKKEEKLQNNLLLGGRSGAGEPQKPALTPEQLMQQQVKEYFKGSQLEKVL